MSVELSTAVSPEQLRASEGGELKAAVRIDAEGTGKRAVADRHLVLCIDASYSMGNEEDESVTGRGNRRIDHAIAGALGTLDELDGADYLSVVSFNTSAEVHVPMGRWRELHRPSVERSIKSISPGGETDVLAGIEASREQLRSVESETPAARKVVLLSDGRDNQNSMNDFDPVLDAVAADGVSIFSAGIGSYDDALMAKVADRTDGISRHLTAVSDIQAFLEETVREAGTVVAPNPELRIEEGDAFKLVDALLKVQTAHKDADAKSRRIDESGTASTIELPDVSTEHRQTVVLRMVGQPRPSGLELPVADVELLVRGERRAGATITVDYGDERGHENDRIERDASMIRVRSKLKEGDEKAARKAIERIDDRELKAELKRETGADKTEL